MSNQRKKLASIVSKIVPKSEVDDVVQDTLIRAYIFKDTFKGDSSYATWLYRIAVNTAFSYLRQRGRRIQTVPFEDYMQISLDFDPVKELECSVEKEILREAVNKLSEDHRIVIDLFYFQNRSCEEIAEQLGCPVGTIWSRLHYSHKKLRSYLLWHEYCIINSVSI